MDAAYISQIAGHKFEFICLPSRRASLDHTTKHTENLHLGTPGFTSNPPTANLLPIEVHDLIRNLELAIGPSQGLPRQVSLGATKGSAVGVVRVGLVGGPVANQGAQHNEGGLVLDRLGHFYGFADGSQVWVGGGNVGGRHKRQAHRAGVGRGRREE